MLNHANAKTSDSYPYALCFRKKGNQIQYWLPVKEYWTSDSKYTYVKGIDIMLSYNNTWTEPEEDNNGQE